VPKKILLLQVKRAENYQWFQSRSRRKGNRVPWV
jgi:hypothetical protein